MARKILGTLAKGNTYTFSAGEQSSGRVDFTFPNTARPTDQATIEVTYGGHTVAKRNKEPAGDTRMFRMGPYHDIVTIKNIGPSTVQVALDY